MKLTLEDWEIIHIVFKQYMEDWIDVMENPIVENEQFLKYSEVYKKILKLLYLKKKEEK